MGGLVDISLSATTDSGGLVATSATNVVVKDLGGWWNPLAGTLLVEATRTSFGDTSFPELIEVDDGTIANRLAIFVATSYGGIRAYAVSSGVARAEFGSRIAVAGTAFRAALSYGPAGLALSARGFAAEVVTLGTIPSVTRLQIGGSKLSGNYWGGRIRNVSYRPYQVSSAELQSLTA